MQAQVEGRVIEPAELERYEGPDLYLFIGISTAGSSVHRTFPYWAPLFNANGTVRGVDIPEDAPAEEFRSVVLAMRDNPRIMGAVVTSHKLRLYRAVSELVDHMDPLVAITHEINSLDTRGGRISAYARDAQSLDIVIDATGSRHPDPTRPVVCIGAGGSAIALMLAMGLDVSGTIEHGSPLRPRPERRRGPLTILGRREASLREIAEVRERAGLGDAPIRLVLAEDAEEVSARTRSSDPGSLVANATGLGKFSPGSPLSSPADFPADAVAWDFNYRGPLTFLEQAHRAEITAEDGWDYFLAGWAAALAAISGVSLDDDFFRAFKEASRQLRP